MLKRAMIGAVIGFVGILGLAKCAGTAPLVECKVAALRVLPVNPEQVTAADVVDLVGRLRACHAGDAGQ